MQFYRIVTLTEDDLALIKEGPEARRLFIDQAAMLENPSFIALSKACRHTIDNRNALLKQGTINNESYQLWTEQLWHKTGIIAHERIAHLAKLQEQLNYLINTYFKGAFSIQLIYQPKYPHGSSFEDFMATNRGLQDQERRMSRSLFGAHLDDFAIIFQDKKSKSFASRGQQKLIVLLLKIAHIRSLMITTGPAIFLLDDYMTDFDPSRSELLLNALIDLNCQLIFTSPVAGGPLEKHLLERGAQKVQLTH
jgi:DNA replication and repair protein RecF